MDSPQESEAGFSLQSEFAITLETLQRYRLPSRGTSLGVLPEISAIVDVTCVGWPIAAAQASSSIFTPIAEAIVSNSRRASSDEISSICNERTITRPIVDTCSNWLND